MEFYTLVNQILDLTNYQLFDKKCRYGSYTD